MASVKHEFKQVWQKPPTHFYEGNYNFGINFYQPMIDYLDDKDNNRNPQEYPHLPWNNERGLAKYGSRKLVKNYSTEDLDKLRIRAESQARSDLDTFKVAKRSDFSLKKSVSAASLTKHVESVSREKITKKTSKTVHKAMADYSKMESDLLHSAMKTAEKHHISRSAKAIEGALRFESMKNLSENTDIDIKSFQRQMTMSSSVVHDQREHDRVMEARRMQNDECEQVMRPLDDLRHDLQGFNKKTSSYFEGKSKQTSIEIEQLNSRVVEAEVKLKTEVTRIKKKYHIQICELEMSLDVSNKNNIELQKTVKKQSLQLTEIQAHYDEVQRQLQVTLDQYGIAQRRLQSLTAEVEEIRGNYETALRSKRTVELQYEESQTRVNELTTINVNISSAKSKIEQELATLAGDYDEITRELRVCDERYQRVQVELKHTVETLHEEQERIVKVEAIKKSLEIEVKNLSIRLEEVEANAIVGGRRIISKLESRMRDLEIELDEEKRRHAETLKILRKKERTVKEVMIQCEEDQKNISLLQETVDKVTQKVNIYKRQLAEQEGMSQQGVTRVRRFQRELEAAEDRAESAESNLTLVRAKHRTFVTTSTVPGSQVYMVQETHRHTTTDTM